MCFIHHSVAIFNELYIVGLNWEVYQQSISTGFQVIPGYKANIRSTDDKVLGVVTDRYTVVQNTEAFSFVDMLLGEGVKFETAGSLQGGKKVWLLARMPHDYKINGDSVSPYLVFSNSHDGSGSIRVAITPVRVVCSNTLNLALSEAQRTWTTIHVGVTKRIQLARSDMQAQHAKQYLDEYIGELESDIQRLEKEKDEFGKQVTGANADIDTLLLIREELRQFVINIKSEPPDIQHSLLQKYVNFTVADLVSDSFKLQFTIEAHGQSLDGKHIKVLEKTLYFKI